MCPYPPPLERAHYTSDVQVFDGVAGITTGDVLLTLWKTPARVERIRRVTEWTEVLMGQTSGTITACQFLLPSASPPNRAGRAETWRGFKIVAPWARRLITVPMGDRVWQGVVRSIIRAGIAVWGRSDLIKIAASEDEAFDLIDQVRSADGPPREALESNVVALYEALGVAREA